MKEKTATKIKKVSIKKLADKESENKKSRSRPFPIVAIGASAGGLEAIVEILKNLSPETGMAYVYVQHLDPTHESLLPEILARVTNMKVLEAREKMRIHQNHLYIIPPNKDMHIIDGVLTLDPRPPRPELHMPINRFFISLAEKQKKGAIAIVLSGNAGDGAQGLKAIKSAGGITFAQDKSAKFQSMPRTAIAEGAVDLVLPPREIAKELERLSGQTPVLQKIMADGDEIPEKPDADGEYLSVILNLLKKLEGIDFTNYKRSTISRRVIRRMLLQKFNTLKEYAQYLKQHTSEISTLYQDLLINVTTFFRDADGMDYLKKKVFPKILRSKGANDPIRVWVPACSTGEEAYSIAIILMEVLGEKAAGTPVQIFATDLSELAISKARLGIYPKADLTEVSNRRLQKYFTRMDSHYRIVKSIRDLCVFAPHNTIKDPPFSRIDLVSCCNLMIYLDIVLQKKVISILHYALNPGGYLMLGKSETIGNAQNLFTQPEKKLHIYQRKKDSTARGNFEMTYSMPENAGVRNLPMSLQRKEIQKINANQQLPDLEKTVDNLLLSQYVPASVVVNEEFEILQFRGSTGIFLEPAPGRASLNLLKMAKAGLGFELRNAIHKVQKSGQPVKKQGIEISHNGTSKLAGIEVLPLKKEGEENYFLVIFRQADMPSEIILSTSAAKDKRVKQLEAELLTSREDMRSLVEEQEAMNEELQSANEEIVSSNEELQSINEELETSKEELESSNEELMTINQELQMRNDQLAEAYDYSQSVFDTIRESVLVLDNNLKVIHANRLFYKTFKVSEEETIGRLIFDLGNRQWDIPKLHELLEETLSMNHQFIGYEVEHDFPQIGKKIMMLNARRVIQKVHRQELTLIAIEDITEHRVAQKIIADRERWFRSMADNAPVMIWTADEQGNRTFFNKTWLAYSGKAMKEETGTGWTADVHPEDLEKLLSVYHDAIKKRQPYQAEYRLRRNDGEYRWMLSSARPVYDEHQNFLNYVGTITEVHDQRMLNQELEDRVQRRTAALHEANLNLERSNHELQQFAFVSSHDLQEPLRKIITFSNFLQKKYKDDLPQPAQEYLTKMEESTKRMSRLIEDLLNFSRVSRNEKFVPTDLNIIFTDVMKDFDLQVKEKNAQVTASPLPVIYAVPVQMNQLFRNLIGNALKFSSKDKTPQLEISSHMLSPEELETFPRLNADAEYVSLIFRDNGIGFDQKYAEQIFEIFQRLNEKSLYSGTGIGLALCRKIAENHGGFIFARSKAGEGSEFHVILPVSR